MSTPIDLTQLPAPSVVEVLDFETILATRKAHLVSLLPEAQRAAVTALLELESEPATKLLEENAYQETILRNRVNDAGKAVMLAFALDGDLDQLGANVNMARLVITPAAPKLANAIALGQTLKLKNMAVGDGNPLARWCYSKVEAPQSKDDIDPFTKDEQAAILAQAAGQGRNLLQFAFWTGLRTSELVALDWADVDFVRGVVMVTRALTQHSKAAESTKTNAGRREVKLLERAMHALQEQKAFTWEKGEEVFQNPRLERRWEGDQPIRKTLWTGVLQNAGVRYRNPYQTRHTYASMMLSAGEHPMWVAKQMGHADWTMIARVYGRWMPDADLMSGSKAEAIFGIV